MVHPWTEFPVRQCFPYHLLVRLLHDKKLLRLHRGRLYPTLRRFPPIARVTRLGAMEHCRCGEATCSGLWTDDENQRKKNTLLSSVAPVREHLSSSNTKHLCGALRNYLSEYLLSGVVAVAVVESKERSLAHQDPFFFFFLLLLTATTTTTATTTACRFYLSPSS